MLNAWFLDGFRMATGTFRDPRALCGPHRKHYKQVLASTLTIQKNYRAYFWRRAFLRLRFAVLVFQKHRRGQLARSLYRQLHQERRKREEEEERRRRAEEERLRELEQEELRRRREEEEAELLRTRQKEAELLRIRQEEAELKKRLEEEELKARQEVEALEKQKEEEARKLG